MKKPQLCVTGFDGDGHGVMIDRPGQKPEVFTDVYGAAMAYERYLLWLAEKHAASDAGEPATGEATDELLQLLRKSKCGSCDGSGYRRELYKTGTYTQDLDPIHQSKSVRCEECESRRAVLQESNPDAGR